MPGFAVTYDPDLRFVVMSMKDGKTYKFGRYEVVHAWLDGYSRGVLSEDDET
jgi:hypothetical protein